MLEGKHILLTGVRNKRSISFAVLQELLDRGAEVLLTSPEVDRTRRTLKRLDESPEVVKLDVTNPQTIKSTKEFLDSRWKGNLDGLVHSIAYADRSCIDSNFFEASEEEIVRSFKISSLSLMTLAQEFAPLLSPGGGSIVAMSFDTDKIMPHYGWMNFFKQALEYFARMAALNLGKEGIRVNCISAGTIKSSSARGIPGFNKMAKRFEQISPLGWDTKDSRQQVAKVCSCLLSDATEMVTGETIHVDGGFHLRSGLDAAE
ncbi:MAG: enoyl-ACP reductase [Candidatus Acetothermia bacterium]